MMVFRPSRSHFCVVLLSLLLAIMLAACGTAKPSPPSATPSPTPAPPTATSPPPTWTPAPNVPTVMPIVPTTLPTSTPRPSATPLPQPTTGVQRTGQTWQVTVVAADLNTAIAAQVAAQADLPLVDGPRVALDFGARVVIDMVWRDPLLEEESTVRIATLVQVEDGRLRLRERREERLVTGPLVSDTAVQATLALVEEGMLAAVMAVAGTTPATHEVTAVRVFPAYLEVTLKPTG